VIGQPSPSEFLEKRDSSQSASIWKLLQRTSGPRSECSHYGADVQVGRSARAGERIARMRQSRRVWVGPALWGVVATVCIALTPAFDAAGSKAVLVLLAGLFGWRGVRSARSGERR